MLNSARFSAGSSRWRRPSTVRKLSGTPSTLTVSPRPLAGSQPSLTANTMISISPTQKVGSEKPRMETVMMVLPTRPCGRRPAHRPSGMPTSTDISMADTASSIVAGKRSRIRPSAGVANANERPRLPAAAFCRNSRYCRHSGWSRPKAAMIFARSAWLASGLIKMSTGLPIA